MKLKNILEKKMDKIFSGVQPTGNLHIGSI